MRAIDGQGWMFWLGEMINPVSAIVIVYSMDEDYKKNLIIDFHALLISKPAQ